MRGQSRAADMGCPSGVNTLIMMFLEAALRTEVIGEGQLGLARVAVDVHGLAILRFGRSVPLEQPLTRVVQPTQCVVVQDDTPNAPVLGERASLWLDRLRRQDATDWREQCVPVQ